MTIGAKIDALNKIRDQKRDLEKEISLLEKEYAGIEAELITLMDDSGVHKSSGKHASASITESTKPAIEDWDAFYKFVRRNNMFHLLEKRPSVTGCRELFEMKRKIPGCVPFVQRKLNLRSLKD